MVAKIETGKSLSGALYYNENKVMSNVAKLLDVRGYGKDCSDLTLQDKLLRLTDLAGRNHLAKTNTVHISLNFDVSESLEKEQLIEISDDYMNHIGFGNQPYLIYQHLDAGHPHLHLLTTNIESTGKRIELHNIGRDRSEPARRAIEIKFGLVRADQKNPAMETSNVINLKPLNYGKAPTKRALTNIVNEVTRSYKFTSLAELNAILGLYNINADRGTATSVMFHNNGLRYWVTDQTGKKQGVPIKASSMYKKPTLKLLEERFRLNDYLRKPLKENVKAKIDQGLKTAANRESLILRLANMQVQLVIRQNSEGRIYGVTFVDHQQRVVFNGSDLGKDYSAAILFQRLATSSYESVQNSNFTKPIGPLETSSHPEHLVTTFSLIDLLLNPQGQDAGVPNQLTQQKKRKKRKKLNF